jgi:hypothetical protein
MLDNIEQMAERGTIEWEARRVAAAFGVEEWEETERKGFLDKQILFHVFNGPAKNDDEICWEISETGRLYAIFVSGIRVVWYTSGVDIYLLENPTGAELMARGLYRLGFEDESVWSQLPQLSAHEKIELRLSLPREFWPKKWVEEL